MQADNLISAQAWQADPFSTEASYVAEEQQLPEEGVVSRNRSSSVIRDGADYLAQILERCMGEDTCAGALSNAAPCPEQLPSCIFASAGGRKHLSTDAPGNWIHQEAYNSGNMVPGDPFQSGRDTPRPTWVDGIANNALDAPDTCIYQQACNLGNAVPCEPWPQPARPDGHAPCRPCMYHSVGNCRSGTQCDFCHDPIHTARRKAKKNARKKTSKKKSNQSSEYSTVIATGTGTV